MSDPDHPRTDPADPESPWRADTFDRWLAALDIADTELDDGSDNGAGADRDDRPPATDSAPDPWAELELDPVDLSSDQREYLAWHEHQPSVPRLHGSADEPAGD